MCVSSCIETANEYGNLVFVNYVVNFTNVQKFFFFYKFCLANETRGNYT